MKDFEAPEKVAELDPSSPSEPLKAGCFCPSCSRMVPALPLFNAPEW